MMTPYTILHMTLARDERKIKEVLGLVPSRSGGSTRIRRKGQRAAGSRSRQIGRN